MIAGLDSSFDRPNPGQVEQAWQAGVRVWGWNISVRGQPAARYVNLRGSSTAANDGFTNNDLGAAVGQSEFNGNLGGGPLASGDGLVLDSTAINLEIVRIGLSYSQG